MDFKSIQKRVASLLINVKYPRVGTIIGLQEEVGNLSGCIMDIEIYDKKTRLINLGDDMANVFFSLIDMCNAYNIEIEPFLSKRLGEIEDRIRCWEKEHGKNLEKIRGKIN